MQTKKELIDLLKGGLATTAIVVSSCLTAQAAYADDASCEQIESFAESVMTVRQKNTPMSVVIKKLRDVNDGEPPEMLKRIVLAAYETPRYHGAEFQHDEIQDFANDVYSECYAARMGNQ